MTRAMEVHNPLRFEIRLSPQLSDKIDRWRRRQPDVPSRAEAARRLIDLGIDASPAPSPPRKVGGRLK